MKQDAKLEKTLSPVLSIPYETPNIKSYSADDLLRELGPALAIYGHDLLAP